MVRQVVVLALRDFKSGLRDFLVLFIFLAPVLLGFLVLALAPNLGGVTVNVVLEAGAPADLTAWLEEFAAVETVATPAELESRVRMSDDVFGLRPGQGSYVIVSQGNELPGSRELLRHVLNQRENRQLETPLDIRVSDAGWQLSPVRQIGVVFLAVFCSVFGGMIIAVNLIEEKQERTLLAINVSPVSRLDFILGKSVLGFLVPLTGMAGILLINGFWDINFGMAAVTILCSSVIAVLVGFSIGVVATDPVTGIASMKTIFLPVMGSVIGAYALAPEWHWTLWWSPWYWSWSSLNAIVLQQATWPQVLRDGGIILALAALVFLILGKKIRQGLA